MRLDRRTGDQLLIAGTASLVALTMWSGGTGEGDQWEKAVGLVALIMGAAHAKKIGDHWQVRGLYLCLALLSVRSFCPWLGPPGLIEIMLHFLFFIFSLLSVLTFPLIRLPPPSGPLPVATLYFSLHHPDGRRLSAQMWYPTIKSNTSKNIKRNGEDKEQNKDKENERKHEKEKEKHRRENVALWGPLSLRLVRTLCRRFHMPSFLLDSISLSSLSSSFMSPLSPPDFCPSLPLILSSHGLFGFKGDRTLFCTDLASHGAVVVGVDHPQDASLTTFEDGTVVECTSDLKDGDDELQVRQEGLRRRITHLSILLDALSPPSPSSSSEVRWEIRAREEAEEVVREVMERVDTKRVGVMGHSFGGATAIALSLLDPRIVSAVALDPWLWPLSPRLPSLLHEPEDDQDQSSGSSSSSGSVPSRDPSPRVLMLSASEWMYGWKQQIYRLRIEKAMRRWTKRGDKGNRDNNDNEETSSWIVKGTNHHNFNDMPVVARPWFGKNVGLIGPSDPYAVHSLINSCLAHFFSISLPFPFLQSPSSFDPSLFLFPHLQALLAPDETFPVPDHAK